MRNKLSVAPLVAGLLAAGAVTAVPAPAAAQDAGAIACSSLTNPVYISGSSASKPVLQALATTLANDGVSISIVYFSPDSCLGVNDLISSQASTESGVSPLYLVPGGTTEACVLNSSSPQPVDIAVSDVFPATCETNAGLTIPSSYVEVKGPIQAMTMVVPGGTNGSSASVISAKAAYVVFGSDATTYTVAPWSVSSNIFVRAETSGTLNMIGTAIGLIPSKWVNAGTTGTPPAQQETSTGNMEKAVATVTGANVGATIGILSAEGAATWNSTAADSATPLKILAFQASEQECGYLPDSSATTFDKINVRQGRYAIWGPLHFLANTGTNGQPTGPDAAQIATVLNYFLATGPNPSATLFTGAIPGDAGTVPSTADIQSLITAEAKPGYVVPWCAMEAQRSAEVGPESSYSSPEPCSCLFETTLGSPVSGHTCTTCSTSSPCSSGVCRYGFCEVQ